MTLNNITIQRFRDHVQKIVQSNRHQAMLGGNPSAIESIKSFLRIKFPLHSKPHNFEVTFFFKNLILLSN